MKALSIRQPWAWLIVNGYKPIENRDWATYYRGPLAIHASGTKRRKEFEQAKKLLSSIGLDESIIDKTRFDFGGIVGQVRLVDCVDKSDSPWFTGKYGFVLADPVALPFFPYKGKLGYFELDDGGYLGGNHEG